MSGDYECIEVPATDREIADALLLGSTSQSWVIRKLTYERDKLLAENKRLEAGNFTEEEFQNFCHNFDADDEARFRAGCEAYQAKLFGPQ